MDCDTTRILIAFDRPGDLAAEDAAALARHLDGCPACAAATRAEKAVDRAIGAAVRAVKVPGGLRAALIEKATADLSKAWWRTWSARTAGAAAVVVAALVGWNGYRMATRPALDAQGIVDGYPADPAAVSAWVAEQGFRGPLPEDFNLQLVTDRGWADVQGVRVPVLRMVHPNAQTASVYLLPPGRFDLRDAGNAAGSAASARVFKDLPGGWAVLVVYTGPDLRPFQRAADPSF